MKAKLDPRLKLARRKHPLSSHPGDDQNGVFVIMSPLGRQITIIVSNELGWDHVSVSVVGSSESPTWDEMCFVKSLLFEPDETVIQYHPAASRYVNIHPGCLHLWRPQRIALPVPPIVMV